MDEIVQTEINEYKAAIEKAWDDYHEGRYQEVITVCEDLICRYPEKSSCHYLLGHVYRVQELNKKSTDEFLIALQKDVDGVNTGYTCYWLGEMFGKYSWLVEADENHIYDKKKSTYYFELARTAKQFPPQLLLNYRHSVKGQMKIDLCEEGILRFPDFTDFYVILAQHYAYHGQSNMQLATYNRAIENKCSSASLFYNMGQFYYKREEYEISRDYFRKALEANQYYEGYSFAINYWLGRIAEKKKEFDLAEAIYREIYITEQGYSNSLLGFLGMLNIYVLNNKPDQFIDLVLNWDASRDLIDNESWFSSPVTFSEYVTDSIESDNVKELYQNLNKFKLDRSNANALLKGKIFLIRALLAGVQSKPKERYNALKKALQLLNVYHYDFVLDLFADALVSLIDNRGKSISNLTVWYNMLISDLEEFNNLSLALSSNLSYIFSELFEAEYFDKVISVARFFTLDQVREADALFELAYSYNEMKDKAQARVVYELCLKHKGDTTAVLNNLGNLYDDAGDLVGALELYSRGLKISPDDKHLNNNHKRVSQKYTLMLEQAAKEKQLLSEQQTSINYLKKENDYVLEKLSLFIGRVKKDESFESWKASVPKYKFQKYMGVDKQRADSLLSQWLAKGYLIDTRQRDDFHVTIYAINPLIEDEIKRLERLKIPVNWINGFLNINVDVLDSKGYFTMMTRAQKTVKKYRPIFERDINELYNNYLMEHLKATIVLSGSLVELALTYYCERRKATVIQFQDQSGKTKSKNLYDCVLSDLIAYVEQNQFFGSDFIHLSNLSRIYRNFVHPGREMKDVLDSAKADLCFISTLEILKKII